MKIIILNGSPHGNDGVTAQYTQYLEIKFPEHTFQTIEIARKINKLERDIDFFNEILHQINDADANSEIQIDELSGSEADPNQVEKTDAQKKIDERNAKREALKARIKEQQIARAQMRDSLKKVAEEKRAAKLKEIEDRKKKREEEIENKD